MLVAMGTCLAALIVAMLLPFFAYLGISRARNQTDDRKERPPEPGLWERLVPGA
jgi:hypothetical protein